MSKIYIDFDGVILDSQKGLELLKDKLAPNEEWIRFLKNIDWKEFINNCPEIPNSLNIIKEVQNTKDISILTKCASIEEMSAKVEFLRSSGIIIPIILVPHHMNKNDIIYPNRGDILIDDYIKNLDKWNEQGGKTILFDYNNVYSIEDKVNSLECLKTID